jgi:uncharacterized protein YegP (UPF0339 family)
MVNIVDIADATNSFKTLVAAVKAAGLEETLKGPGPFTFFAPDDEAFAKLPQGTVEALLKDVPKLKAILMYHVVAGKLTVDEIGHMQTIKTLQGQEVRVDAAHWHYHINPKINDAYITSKDVVTDNGIIHVLTRVLMPNMELTCPICGMGFMTMQALGDHNKTAHLVEKTPEPPMPAQAMPVVEAEPEPLPPTEVITEQTPVIAKVTGVFEVFYDAVYRFRFHLKAGNGQIIAASQSYGTKEAALKAIASIQKNAPLATIADSTTREPIPDSAHRGIVQDPDFEIHCDSAGKFRFHLKAANGEIIATSQSYLSRESAEKGIASIKKNAPIAKIIDHTVSEA